VQLLGSGTILRECLAAAEILERKHKLVANVWSVTSWTELRWDGMLASGTASAAVREARNAVESVSPPFQGGVPAKAGGVVQQPWLAQCLAPTRGPVIAASDYVSAVADLVRPWVPGGRPYVALGTDGFGRSDTRVDLRRFFGVSRDDIVTAALRESGRS
jgi:pyruvate dehydrogenase E1 component